MPEPQLSSVVIKRAITEAAIRYQNSTYIADRVAPVINVDKDGKYFIFDKAPWFRDDATTDRRPGDAAPRGGWTMSNADFKLQTPAHGTEIPDEIQDEADDPLDPFRDA